MREEAVLFCAIFFALKEHLQKHTYDVYLLVVHGMALVCIVCGYKLNKKIEFHRMVPMMQKLTGWELREYAGMGVWCCILLPLATVLPEYNLRGGLDAAVGLSLNISFLICSILTIHILCDKVRELSLSKTKTDNVHLERIWKDLIPGVCLASIVGTAVPYFLFKGKFGAILLGIGILGPILYTFLLLKLPKCLPKSFTFGEATIVAQSLVLFVNKVFLKIVYMNLNVANDQNVSTITMVAVLSVGVLVLLLRLFPVLQTTRGFYFTLLLVSIGAVTGLYLVLQDNLFMWLYEYIFYSSLKRSLFTYWLVMTGIAVLIVIYQNNCQKSDEKKTSTTVVRKYFHIIAVCVYLPGLLWDPEFLYLASIGAFCVFVLLESIRTLCVYPFGEILNIFLQVFLDERDGGQIILTHIYLLVGCSLSLWISPYDLNFANHLPLYSGILSLGIGDMVASVFGTAFGKTKWAGSEKSVEGTAAAFVAQIAAIALLMYFGVDPNLTPSGHGHLIDSLVLNKIVIGIALTSLLEAWTTQIDNLVLPLFMYAVMAG
ncbi:dolichol kinase [Lingula anatina]|uniref:dolichol kinase n=1 Tax=Lingula anatina TaxID=7574 RepID=A0A1S3I019_LINAN|nr:dolichol kinase [Lingula anatina]|eukprot:XP_013391612.1 dolichol kinase [Lingula anatina]